jgi:hypothetical protein
MKQTMSRNVIDDDTVSESFSQGKFDTNRYSELMQYRGPKEAI